MKLDPGDFFVDVLTNDGRGPIDPALRNEVIGGHTPRRAAECVAADEVYRQYGIPAFDRDGTFSVDVFLVTTDANGNQTAQRVRVTLKLQFEVTPHTVPADAGVANREGNPT